MLGRVLVVLPHTSVVEAAVCGAFRVVFEGIGKVLIETFATQQGPPEDITSVAIPPWLTNLSGPLRVIDGTRGMDAYCTSLTSDQAHQ